MTYTHLTIGTSKIPAKPPRAQPPCTDPALFGANVLKDPSVELQLANYGGGPLGDETPMFSGLGGGVRWPLVWSDDTDAPASTGLVSQYYGPAGDDDYRWKISTANPNTGTYHLRILQDSSLKNYQNAVWVDPYRPCGWSTVYWGNSTTVFAGDYIAFTLSAMASQVGATPRLNQTVTVYDDAYSSLATFQAAGFVPVTTSYAAYTVDGFAPTGAKYLIVTFDFTVADLGFTGGSVNIDVDDFVLEVS